MMHNRVPAKLPYPNPDVSDTLGRRRNHRETRQTPQGLQKTHVDVPEHLRDALYDYLDNQEFEWEDEKSIGPVPCSARPVDEVKDAKMIDYLHVRDSTPIPQCTESGRVVLENLAIQYHSDSCYV